MQGADGKPYECKACGRFRIEHETPLPGDEVVFMPDTAYIESILPRRSELKRPRVANVDTVVIVVSANSPKIDPMLCDKLLLSARRKGIHPLLVINKCDSSEKAPIEAICNDYRHAAEIIRVSAYTGSGLDTLKEALSGRCSCFAGQSAVGKSSVLNAMFPEIMLKTDGLSKKTERGKHTTRHAELLMPEGFFGTVIDTPGFSFFESDDIAPESLWEYYEDMRAYGGSCRYPSCLHAGEPGCGIKDAVAHGDISQTRYERYLEILKELKEMREKRYD